MVTDKAHVSNLAMSYFYIYGPTKLIYIPHRIHWWDIACNNIPSNSSFITWYKIPLLGADYFPNMSTTGWELLFLVSSLCLKDSSLLYNTTHCKIFRPISWAISWVHFLSWVLKMWRFHQPYLNDEL